MVEHQPSKLDTWVRFPSPALKIKYFHFMREWLRGGAPPCQGGGRGFESRLALFLFSEDPGFAGSFIFVYKNEKAGSEEPAIHGTIRSAPFS